MVVTRKNNVKREMIEETGGRDGSGLKRKGWIELLDL